MVALNSTNRAQPLVHAVQDAVRLSWRHYPSSTVEAFCAQLLLGLVHEVKCLDQRRMSCEFTQIGTTTKVTSSRHSKSPNHMPTRDLLRSKLDNLTSSTEI